MPPINDEVVVRRIDELLTTPARDISDFSAIQRALQGTLTLLNTVHGPNSEQQANLLRVVDYAHSKPTALQYNFMFWVWPAICGTLQALKADIQTGLVGNVHRRAVGEVVADMLGLAKEALANGTDGAKNVAAVLAAAAFEDMIRTMGSTLANVQGRPDLSIVLAALRAAKLIEGAAFTTAQGYLKFRNDALHADWGKLNAAVVGSCIAYVEQLLLAHLS